MVTIHSLSVAARVSAIGVIAACMCGLVAVSGAGARGKEAGTVEPHTRVGGTLVVQGSSRQSVQVLFGIYCDPVVLTPGRRSRECGTVPNWSRLFVGYGIFALPKQIDAAWREVTWKLWLDGQPVDLAAFGTSDRVLPKYPPAGGKDVVLREWSIVLVRPTLGRHTIRYRASGGDGATDTTWRFTIRQG